MENKFTTRRKLINNYLLKLDELIKLNKQLYDNTQYYEHNNTLDFDTELFNYFSGKINIYQRYYNQLMKLINS